MNFTVILGSMAIIGAIGMLWWGLTARPSAARANLFAGLAQDPTRQRRLADEPITPHVVEQLLLRDNPIAALDEVGQHVEHLRLDRHDSAIAPHLLADKIDFVPGKTEDQIAPHNASADRACA